MLPAFSLFAVSCGTPISFLGFPTWYKYLDCETVAGKLTPIFNVNNDPAVIGKIILAVIEILLRVGGMVAVGFVIYGGFQYMLTQGEPQKAVSARHTIVNAIVGMLIASIAVFIVQLIGSSLIN